MNKTSLTRDEFLAFLLLYAAHADLKIEKHEKDFLHHAVCKNQYKSACERFDPLNDYERLQVIMDNKARYAGSRQEKDEMLKQLRQMFLADGKYVAVERAVSLFLENLLEMKG